MVTTVEGIRIYFLSFILMGLNIVMSTYIQSKEYARVSMVISLMRGLVLIVIYLIILPRAFGIHGVWLTLPAVELTTMVISVICFKQYRDALSYSIKNLYFKG